MPRPPVPTFGDRFTPPPKPGPLPVIALVLAVLLPVVGLVLGVVARRRLAAQGSRTAVATAAIVVGAVLTALLAAAVVLVTVFPDSLSRALTPQLDAPVVARTIAERAGYPAGSVTCPDPLPATIGASTVCAVKAPNAPASVLATVRSVENGTVQFDVTPQ